MILQALVELAKNERLISDPDFEFKPVAWIVRLKGDGSFIEVEDNRQNLKDGQTDKKGKPIKPKWAGRRMLVPIQSVRTSGDVAYFAVDKADYVFGTNPEKPDRLRLFYDQIDRCAKATDDVSCAAVNSFGQWLHGQSLEARVALLPHDLIAGELIAFRIGNDPTELHGRAAVRAYWKGLRNPAPATDESAIQADRRCLITLKPVDKVPLFRKVKNMPGDSSGGLSLVSFNSPAWESYGWTGEDNAPVSRDAAEAVVTALSRLLDSRPTDGTGAALQVRRIRLSEDTAVVFWSPQPIPEAQQILDALPDLFNPSDEVTDVGNLFSAVRTGLLKELQNPAAFYAMTLTTVTGRIVVRDWFESTVAELQQNLKQHFADLDCLRNTPPLKGQPMRGVLRLNELLDALATSGRDAQVPAVLAAGFIHAAFRGTNYPFGLLQRALMRARAEAGGDQWIDSVRRDARAAMLKAILNRRRRLNSLTAEHYSEVHRDMDPTNQSVGYNLGALLAVLERLQAAALGDVNASIIDKYFASASATPRVVFDRLLRGARHHARKAQDEPKAAGQAFLLDRLIDELVSRFKPPSTDRPSAGTISSAPAVGIPPSLDLEQQALFVLGYHHMRRFLWMSREERDAWQAAHPDAPQPFLRKNSEKTSDASVA